MRDIYLTNYSVKGIKTLDEWISLSFYKKTITKDLNTQDYNIKGIYGMNGSGKSAIVASIDILKNLLIDTSYLGNPIVQKNLEAMVNKKLGTLSMEAEYITNLGEKLMFFRYGCTLSKDKTEKYVISSEYLYSKTATSKSDLMENIFQVTNGEIISIAENVEYSDLILKKTTNLLSNASMCSLFFEKILISELEEIKKHIDTFLYSLVVLMTLGKKIYVSLEQADDHRDYFIQNSSKYFETIENNEMMDLLMKYFVDMDNNDLNVLSVSRNIVPKVKYQYFECVVEKLSDFLKIFKSDLVGIEIDRKEDTEVYVCSLIMVYESYKIHAEFESTGIKKLIRLFVYLREMAQGGIVFIDELDSNLHDVYLCALLEYLMEYGQGQLCFTTHNVGPMDILKRNKKSIDFLSMDHKIYPWTKNGNYSPSKLYRNGMIEGSPFNVDSIDFIGVFSNDEEVH